MSDLTEEDKQRINNALINTIRNNVKKEYSCGKIQDNDSVTDWCNIDCELSQKYKFVNIHSILQANVKVNKHYIMLKNIKYMYIRQQLT